MNARTVHPGFLTALWLLPLLTIVQVSLMSHFTVRDVYPNIVLIFVLNWGVLRGPDQGMMWALWGGLCIDVFSGWPFGTSAVALVIVASLVSLGEGTFMRTHALVPLATIFGGTVLYYLIALFILESTQHSVDWMTYLQSVVLPVALYNAILNIPGFWMAQKLEHRIYPMPRAHW